MTGQTGKKGVLTNGDAATTINVRPTNDPYHDTPGAIAWRQACLSAAVTSKDEQMPILPSAPGWICD